jgi:putative SbcD/Mre11-related phosphoesterase
MKPKTKPRKHGSSEKSDPYLRMVDGVPALILNSINPRTKILIVGDLHLGYEGALRDKGFSIPSQHENLITKLTVLVTENQIDTLYIIGDLKHGTLKITSTEWFQVPTLLDALSKIVKVHIIKGNHDGDIEALCSSDITVHSAKGLALLVNKTKILLLHGHAWPKPSFIDADIVITGHIHPVYIVKEEIKQRGQKLPVWMQGCWNPKQLLKKMQHRNKLTKKLIPPDLTPKRARIIFLPAFNPLISGYPVNTAKQPFQGIWKTPGLLPLEEMHLYLLDGTYLGLLSDLRSQNEA